MPIKLSKVLVRRKSSGTILDTIEDAPPISSFRVLNRQEVEDITSDGGPESKQSSGRLMLSPPSPDDARVLRNRGSRRIKDSVSTLGSSSACFSNASTQPSSLASASEEDLFPINRPSSVPLPRAVTPQSKHMSMLGFPSIGKTFFTRPKTTHSADNAPTATSADVERATAMSQAMTANSYASTAVSSGMPFERPSGNIDEELDAGDLFEGFTNRRRSVALAVPTVPPPVARSESDSMLLTRNQYATSDGSYAAPLSRHLGVSPAPDMYRTHSWETDASQKAFLTSSPTILPEDGPVHVQAGAEVVMDALYASHYLDQEHGPAPIDPHTLEPLTISDETHPNTSTKPETPPIEGADRISTDATSRGSFVQEKTNSYFGNRCISYSYQNDRSLTLPQGTRKIMTPAEFEQYKRQQVFAQAEDNRSDTTEESMAYEDEDETERTRQVMKARRKQEAHLAVYRQSMMKVTGETSSAAPRPTIDRATQSTPNFFGNLTSYSPPTGQDGQSSDEEEDENVPLAILHAHGFPSKNRPPTRLSNLGSPELRQGLSSYPAPSGSSRNDASAGGGGSLPPFAKGLPPDPYIGANLVNPSNRESLAAANPSPRDFIPFTYQSPNTRTPPPQLRNETMQTPTMHGLLPGGLVSIIAEEERAKAMRRGSPNVNGPLLPQPLITSQQWPQVFANISSNAAMGTNMPMPPPSPMSAGEHAQVQMNNSMTMMMQLQMQWMQQMMHMQGMPSNAMQQQHHATQLQSQPPFAMPLRPASTVIPAPTPRGLHHQRGTSTTSFPALETDYFPPTYSVPLAMPTPSTQSIYGLQMQNQARPSMYTPSLAPSERSNIGQPSRYRPISTAAPPAMAHSAAAAVQTTKPFVTHRHSDYLKPMSMVQGKAQLSADVETGPGNVKSSAMDYGDDEEDDEGWMKMKRQREERTERWRKSRQLGAGGEMDGIGMENEQAVPVGLFYESA